jgi:hypothetical protein
MKVKPRMTQREKTRNQSVLGIEAPLATHAVLLFNFNGHLPCSHAPTTSSLSSGQLLQLGDVSIKDIGISAILVGVVVLPNSVERPVAGDWSGLGIVVGKHQWTGRVEIIAITRAIPPPIISSINHGITTVTRK